MEYRDIVKLYNEIGGEIMDSVVNDWENTEKSKQKSRRAYYLSCEYLMGNMINNNLHMLGMYENVKNRLREKEIDISCLEFIPDVALGNGGLGRLSACFLDSAATHNIPLDGYGLRYKYGFFRQQIENGFQREYPDDWTRCGDVFSVRRECDAVNVDFADMSVIAIPYDMPIIGLSIIGLPITGNRNNTVNTLRLWQCEPIIPFNYSLFSYGKYDEAVRDKNRAEDITRVLYPDDSSFEGKKLRLRQQYFLSSATLKDIIRTYKKNHSDLKNFADYVTIQLNDTHPVISIPELIRLLMIENMSFENAFEITRNVFNYTNHTVMSEALERWNASVFEEIVPEIYGIIKKLDSLSPFRIIDGNIIHMVHLACFGSKYINGVAKLHTEILKKDVLKKWYSVAPQKFQNKTNGVTQRRWFGFCNGQLAKLVGDRIGYDFMFDMEKIADFKPFINEDTIKSFNEIKYENKKKLAEYMFIRHGIEIPQDFIIDSQIKRLHEYKRQLMNAFSILYIYYGIKDGYIRSFYPTVFIFGAKAAVGYTRAKGIIKFINEIANKVNSDKLINKLMRVIFVPDYNCSAAEKIMTASDVSEQISLAGTEASGTGNMKFMMNGAVTLGTYDGANIEIIEQAGKENNYIFGMRVEDIKRLEHKYNPMDIYLNDIRIKRVVDSLVDGTFSDESSGMFREIYNSLLYGADYHRADNFYVLLDLMPYIDAKWKTNRDYQNRIDFGRKCLYNMTCSGIFSSDRTVKEYAKDIWKL